MQSPQEFIHLLSDGVSEASQQAWKSFLYNVEQVRLLGDAVSQEAALALIGGGAKWSGSGWTTSSASKRLHELTQVPLVTADFKQYVNAWLYCLALLWNVEVAELTLSDPAAEAAFRLASVCGQADWSMDEDEGEEVEERDLVVLDWDEAETKCPEELAFIWKGVLAGERKLDLKTILAKIPRFEGLPSRPPENNFRGDAQKRDDRERKAWQQTLLHILRLLTAQYPEIKKTVDRETRVLFQQTFQLVAELEVKVESLRRESSIPGSTPQSGPVLFGKDEVAQAAQVNKVNGSKFYNGGIPNSRPFGHSFRPLLSASTGGFRGKNSKGFRPAFKGFSKGYGKSSSYRTFGGQGYDSRPSFRGGAKGRGAFKGVRTFGRQARAAGSPRVEARAAHTLSFQAKAMSAMVAAACRASSDSTHRKRCAARVASQSSAKPAVDSPKQFVGRSLASRASIEGVLGNWCSFGSTANRGKIFGSLVCHQQDGEGKREVATNFRLQTHQRTFGCQTLQDGSLGKHIPLLKTRHVGRKARLAACLLSPGIIKHIEGVCGPQSWGQILPISRSSLRSQHPPTTLDDGHEDLFQALAPKRDPLLHLSGRHFGDQQHSKGSGEGPALHAVHTVRSWDGGQHEKVCFAARTGFGPFGFHHRSQGGLSSGTHRKAEINSKGVRETPHPPGDVLPKDGSHFGIGPKFSDGHALSQSIHGQYVKVCEPTKTERLGQKTTGSPLPPRRGQGAPNIHTFLGRETLPRKSCSPTTSLRLLTNRMGWLGQPNWGRSPRVLERPRWPPHKRERAPS